MANGFSSTPNSRGKKETLHYLAISSSTTAVDAARSLLERGTNPQAIDKEGMTPLHYSCLHDNVAMTQLLLTFGCDPMSTDRIGRTALSLAKGNTLRFLRRFQKKNQKQRLGLFRRFFACHSHHQNTFFIARNNNERKNVDFNSSLALNRGNALTKSYRNAKKKIRATLHVFNRNDNRSRSNSDSQFRDIVMTSEGPKIIETPTREAKTKRSMSTSDANWLTPNRNVTIRKNEKKTPTVKTPQIEFKRRSKTPDPIGKGTIASKIEKNKRSKSQEKIICSASSSSLIKAPVRHNPMNYYNTEKARIAGLRPQPTAPPLSPEIEMKHVKMRDKSSDFNSTAYWTANEDSLDILEDKFNKLKIVEKEEKTPKKCSSNEEGSDQDEIVTNENQTPKSIDDGELRKIRRLRDVELRNELKKYGISPAGPFDARHRRIYEKKLLTERRKIIQRGYSPDIDQKKFKYSPQLEIVLKTGSLPLDFSQRVRKCDELVRNEFCGNGFGYTAFCYLIMDPRILGKSVENVTLSKFVQSIFYVGKGSKNRPLAHFIDARNERKENSVKLKNNEKLKKIDELWTLGYGIPRHEIAHGISDEEAYVYEASLIEAIRLQNLTNKKLGEFHGSTKNWDSITKSEYGVYLLNRALSTLKAEGIRLIKEENLPENIYPYVNNRRGGQRTPKTPK